MIHLECLNRHETEVLGRKRGNREESILKEIMTESDKR